MFILAASNLSVAIKITKKMNLTDVSKIKLLNEGFLQCSYAKKQSLLLLFDVKQGVELPLHKHPHAQFGYCFHGEFDFCIDGQSTIARPSDSYLLGSDVYHSAIATEDYYSMDYKYRSALYKEKKKQFNVLKEIESTNQIELSEIGFQEKNLGKTKITKILGKEKGASLWVTPQENIDYLIVISRETSILINSNKQKVESMKIYRIEEKDPFELVLNERNTVIFLCEM